MDQWGEALWGCKPLFYDRSIESLHPPADEAQRPTWSFLTFPLDIMAGKRPAK
jgi:hypothetical protein